MNTSVNNRRCPQCSAEIPSEAPQGLCPKCLLMGVASEGDWSVEAGTSNSDVADAAGGQEPSPRDQAKSGARDNRPAVPSIEVLAAAFPQLEILQLIGRGGMGFVYKARQLKLDRLVALKILPVHLATEPSFHERFEREARVLAKLQHPHIVSVYDFGEATVDRSPAVERSLRRPESRQPPESVSQAANSPDAPIPSPTGPTSPADSTSSYFYLMLEFVDGVNLREAMRVGRFTPEQVLAIVPQVCEALQYAHSKGVLHRDIKPENILLDTDGRVKIADFGIAKVLDPALDPSSSPFASSHASESEMAVTRLTATGSVLGTPLYMAPEQLISPNSVDHRADIFSLGVVFYEMLTGELPMGRFAPPSEKSLADQQIDRRIDEIVLRALAKERELRQQSAGELKTEVETVSSQPRAQQPFAQPTPHADKSSEKTGHAIPMASPALPNWLLSDVGRILLTLLVIGVLTTALPILMVLVSAPFFILNTIIYEVILNGFVQGVLPSPIDDRSAAGTSAGITAFICADLVLCWIIWRRWLRHFSPRRAGLFFYQLFQPLPPDNRPHSESMSFPGSAVASGSVVPQVSAETRERSKPTGGPKPPPVPLDANSETSGRSKLAAVPYQPPVRPEVVAVRANTSGRGGWWALASLIIGTPLALTPFVGFRAVQAVQIDPANPPPQPSPTWMAFMFVLMILFIVGGLFTPIVLGWRHLIRQRRDYSRNGIIPAMIAAWFVPMCIADTICVNLFLALLFPYSPPYVAHGVCLAISAVAIDVVILYATGCWVTHTPIAVPRVLKSHSFWRPVLAVVVSMLVTIPVGWSAVEAVQSYGRYEFTRFDTSADHLVPKSRDYGIASTVWSTTKTRGNRSEPFPSEAYWEMRINLKKNKTPFMSSTVEVNLATLTLNPHHQRIPFTEETLLARMKSAGIDTDRLEVQAEARSLVATAEKLRDQFVQHLPLSLASQIDENHWTVTTMVRQPRTTRHGWNVTYQGANYSVDVRVNEEDAFFAMSGIFSFWLIGLMGLLWLTRDSKAKPPVSISMPREESPRPRRVFWLAASVVAAVPVTIVLALVAYRLSGNPPQPLPQPSAVVMGSPNSSHASFREEGSAAAVSAKRLGLIRVAEEKCDGVSSVNQPIGLCEDYSRLIASALVEPHFSILVHFSKPCSTAGYYYTVHHGEGDKRRVRFVTPYPIDYIACDWTSEEDNPLIIGYMLPPGAYDFRADVETVNLLSAVDAPARAKFASDVLKAVADSAETKPITESDWQQAARGAYVRFKLVPKTLSKLNVPEECLVVLTDGSRTVFTRDGGRFTGHVLESDAPIRELRDSIGKVNLEAEVKALLDKAHRAVKQQNWEELLTCFTADGRDEWMFEIIQGCAMAAEMTKEKSGAEILSSVPALGTLTQHFEELRKLAVDPTVEQGNLLEMRFQNYSKLSASEGRQLRVDMIRSRYPDMIRVARTTLAIVRELDPKQMIIDFSQVSDLHIDENWATGTWSTTTGAHNPIILRRVAVDGQLVWRIYSLVGKSVIDPPYMLHASPVAIEHAAQTARGTVQPETQPADATAPENTRRDIKVEER
jgi:serine/threonine protein kinase